ncbi:MAG: protoporphyrinogen oxidase [Verrucomicrobia bacterium]|nr:protoporphyrinogen oxidase [Verrucomicrobiota bacterium]
MIAILGGGITGLTVAHQLKKQGKEFVLIEAAAQLGGNIQSHQYKDITFELGPNTVLMNKPEVKELIEDLELNDRLIFADNEASKQRFVLKNGSIEAIPNSFSSLIKSRLFSLHTLYRIIKEPFIRKKSSNQEESLAAFIRRRFGDQILNDFVAPFVGGIYAGDPEKMSVAHTLKMLVEAEESKGSVLRGIIHLLKKRKRKNGYNQLPKQKIFTFPNGLQEIAETIEKKIEGSFLLNAKVNQITINSEKAYTLDIDQSGKKITLSVDQIVSTVPAHVLSCLLESVDKKFSVSLKSINYVPAMVTHLIYPKTDLHFSDKPFGILSRKSEGVPFLGILFNHSFFPQQSPNGKLILTVISGGYKHPELLNLPEEELLSIITSSVEKLLDINEKVEYTHIKKWEKAIPQYELGYAQVKTSIHAFEEAHANFYIGGNFYEGVSVSDCIARGFRIAQMLE